MRLYGLNRCCYMAHTVKIVFLPEPAYNWIIEGA